jgi:WD40 repeat protein
MSLDELGRAATESLRERVDRDVDPPRMLRSVRRTRVRRRNARLAVPLALAAVVAAAVAVWPDMAHRHQEPVKPPKIVVRGNGALLGYDAPALSHHGDLHLPPLALWSTPTFSPDGDEIAVLAGGILVTDVETGAQRQLPCSGCSEIAWSPDGSRFAAVDQAGAGIGLVDATTGRMTDAGVRGLAHVRGLSWSPDGRQLVFIGDSQGGGPRIRLGAFVADLDHGSVRVLLAGPLANGNGTVHAARVLAVSWSATRDRIAILTLNAGPRGFDHPSDLGVVSVSASGSGMTALATDGTCVCVGWTPDLTWSPDGQTVAVYSQHEGLRHTLDADGAPVRVRFVRGSGWLVWQPR